MALGLEQRLELLCEQNAPALDLGRRLDRVRLSAEEIWREQRLQWFTDHRAMTHSRHVVEHLGHILAHLEETPQRLTVHELYVLLCACYLHDIGMQDLQACDGRGVEQFTEEDYDRIRSNHPRRSKEMIIQRMLAPGRDEFRIHLDADLQYLVPIALVSQGHGSAFFDQTADELRSIGHRPGNMAFRGDLLAALLLVADELDLHEGRATFPKEFALSPVSLLHHYVHHYVTGVEVVDGRTPKQRRIRLTIEFPEDSASYRGDVCSWLTNKLQKQCRITKPVFEACTEGELGWDDQIEIRQTVDHYGVRRSLLQSDHSRCALSRLRHDALTQDTVDRDELLKATESALEEPGVRFRGIRIVDREKSDWSQFAKWLTAICDIRRECLVHVAFQESVGHGPVDVLFRLSDHLKKAGLACSRHDATRSSIRRDESGFQDVLGEALVTDMQNWADASQVVLLLERVDLAEPGVARWLEDWLVPRLSHKVKMLLIVTSFEEETGVHWGGFRGFKLSPFTETQIAHHLKSQLGFSPQGSESEAKYVFGLSSGAPASVYVGLSQKRRESVRFV